MSYSLPNRMTYSFGLIDFGASDTTDFIRGPAGKTGTIVEIHGSTREIFTATTLAALVQVGVAGTVAAYCSYNFGTMADNVGYCSRDNRGNGGALTITTMLVPADTDILLTFRNTTGGSPTGQATVDVVVEWAD